VGAGCFDGVMSRAPVSVVDQAARLVESTRVLPADDAAKVLEQVVGMVQAAQVEILRDAERSGGLRDCGCASVRSFAATILRRGIHDAASVAQTARHLDDLPQLAAAYRAGQIHTGNLRTILNHRKPCGLAVLQAHQPQLVLLATQTGPKQITEFCQMLADLNHPDRDQAKAKALGLRSVRIVRVGDLARLDAMLDPAVADQLKATLAAMTKAARHAERQAEKQAQKQAEQRAGQDGADDADAGGWGDDRPVTDPRTHGERSADALEELLRRGMTGTDLPTQKRSRPHATVSVQLETLLGMNTSGQALLHRFGVISTKTAQRLACDALVRLIVNHGDRVLNVGDRSRVVNTRQHAALAQTYSTCVVPGCQIPFTDCDIHHLWWWHLSGPTDLDLQLPLCGSHHIWLHEGGYSITREHDQLVFRDPRGRLIANLNHILQEQLDLLEQQPRPAARPRSSRAEQLPNNVGGWPNSRYQHGHWGWNGNNPAPPPGHAPPQPTSTN
ncbi:MAG: DUF222 domain-containing protein, partial [Nocardioidaceae bacterium]